MKRVLAGASSVWITFCLAALVALVLPRLALTQVISGDLVGTVLDKSGAVVPGAEVEVTNSLTGVKYETKANESGEYRFNNLPVGTYAVSASAPNFATTRVNGFQVELNKVSTLQITLDVKGTVTSVEVTGTAPALDTSTAQLTNTFDTKLNADLPVSTITGGVLNLSLLSAGVATGGGIGAGTGPSVGGQRPRNNNFTIEGVDNNNKSVTGPLVMVPNDAVAEFSVLQNQFAPDFGHSSGGQFNTIIKSGTNSYHGTAYLYSENRNFDAIDQSTINNGLTSNPRFDDNRMGGTVGGPIVKNKLFFFGALEYNPVGQAAVLASPVCSPTAAGYAALSSVAGVSQTNLSILKKYVAPAGQVEVAPAGKNVCGTGQDANLSSFETVNGAAIPEGILSFAGPNYTNNWAALGSIDYDFSSKDQLRGRYIYNRTTQIDTNASLPAFYLTVPFRFHLVTINEYHTFNPNLQNEFRLGYNRYFNTTPAGNFSFPGLDSFPNIILFSLNGINIGPDPNAPQFTIQNTYQAADAVSWTHATHTLKFGVEGRKLIAPESFIQRARGDYDYNSLQQYLDDHSPDFLGQRSVGVPTYYGDQAAIYWYVNDNWRLRPNFTLNLGVRYEYTTTPFGIRSQSLNSIANVPGLVDFSAPRAPKNDWGPRVGFAYSPGTSGRTSIRAGFGIAYDVHYDNIGILSLPPELNVTENVSPTANTPNFLANGGLLPGTGQPQTFATAAAAKAATSSFYPPNVKDPKSMDWTLGVQHTFGNDYTVEVRYIGTRGLHMPVQDIVNLQALVTPSLFLPTSIGNVPSQAALDARTTSLGTIEGSGDGIAPAFDAAGFNQNILTAWEPVGSSTYHGLAAQVTRRLSHGLQFVGAYTFSHNIDNSTADFHSTDITPRRPQDFQNIAADRANSALDHRHRFTLAVLYDVPYFKSGNAFTKNILGNWEIAPIYTYQTGEWATAQDGVDANLNGDAAGDRPIFNPAGIGVTGSGVSPLCRSAVPSGDCTIANLLCTGNPTIDGAGSPCPVGVDIINNVVGYSALNSKARYVQAQLGALANVGRDTVLMPATNNWDLTAIKRISFTERYRAEFGVEAFNLFNHPQFLPCCAANQGPGALGGATNQVTSQPITGSSRAALEPQKGIFNNFSAVFPSEARALQLSLKVIF